MSKEKAGKLVNTEISPYAELARKLVTEIPSKKDFEEQESLWDELIEQAPSEDEVLALQSADIGIEYKARIVAIFLTPKDGHIPFIMPRRMSIHPTPRRELVEDIPAGLLQFTAKLMVGALKLGFNSLVETAVEVLCRLEPGTEDADKLYSSIPLAYVSESREFGYYGYRVLMAKVGEKQVPQSYKEKADAAMRERVTGDWHGDPMVWYARTLEFLVLDTPYDPAFFASQLQFIIRSSKMNGKKYEDVFVGPHNGVFARVYHFLADESWKELRLQFIVFAKKHIEDWVASEMHTDALQMTAAIRGSTEGWEESCAEQHGILLKIAEDIENHDQMFARCIRDGIARNSTSLRDTEHELQERILKRRLKVADILSRMK